MKEVTPDEVVALLMGSTEVSIIDVRESSEVEAGKIPEAMHIPLGELQTRLAELEKTTEYVIICRSGNRSGIATQFLNSLGYNASNMVGGMLEWKGTLSK
ncbi:rhodanese-like domain-containing protein [Oceanobacillus luteolus]|uniref:Rhodanese-like domain-containing protein n=1 Tax=Oceanobacillus luteolus TaxID=1274358 RepID=A0ABW4HSW7_9BACI